MSTYEVTITEVTVSLAAPGSVVAGAGVGVMVSASEHSGRTVSAAEVAAGARAVPADEVAGCPVEMLELYNGADELVRTGAAAEVEDTAAELEAGGATPCW